MDLDDILSSALDDLDLEEEDDSTPPSSALSSAAAKIAEASDKSHREAETKAKEAMDANPFLGGDMSKILEELDNPEFLKGLEDAFKSLGGEGEDLSELTKLLGGGANPGEDLSDAQLEETIKMLSQAAGGDGNEEDMMKKMMESLGAGGEGGFDEATMQKMMAALSNDENGGMASMVDNMMTSLLKKEVMYPPIKEISKMYPSWLAENASSVSSDDKERYEKQVVAFDSIVTYYESGVLETAEAKGDAKQEYADLMDLLNSLQELGEPPAEVLKILHPEGQGVPPPGMMAGDPNQCPTQ